MGRRSDHSSAELREIIISEAHRQISEVGFARFSAREVARRIGYSIGTIYNVFGSYDHLMLAINGRTLDMWRSALETRLANAEQDRLRAAVEAYFDFALQNRHAWTAIYDFRLPDDAEVPDEYSDRVRSIMDVVAQLLTEILPPERASEAQQLSGSLLAIVHGHCFFMLSGTFRVLGETDPLSTCMQRVRTLI